MPTVRVITVSLHQSYRGQRMANVFHFRSTPAGDLSPQAQVVKALEDLFATSATLLSLFSDCQMSDVLYTHATGRVHPNGSRLEYVFPDTMAVNAGAIGEEDLEPPNLAFPLRLETAEGPKHNGRCFLSGVGEHFFELGVPSPAGAAIVGVLGAWLTLPHTIDTTVYQCVVPQYALDPDDDDCATPRTKHFVQYNDVVAWNIPLRAWQQGRRRWPVGG